jgi:hypothetical protein
MKFVFRKFVGSPLYDAVVYGNTLQIRENGFISKALLFEKSYPHLRRAILKY